MFNIYRYITQYSAPILHLILKYRVRNGKEHPLRVKEKQGIITLERNQSPLIWLHAASVGEAQSSLILINHLLDIHSDIEIIVTTGTLTSANMMKKKLPKRAFHQFAPLDHPLWVAKFLDYWDPKCIFWMESELWPNTLHEIKDRDIPAILINARMSARSYKGWLRFKKLAKDALRSFDLILSQTENDKHNFLQLGAHKVISTGNMKFSASKLTVNKPDLHQLQQTLRNRPIWLYASTHSGEEKLACELHEKLKASIPDLLTIIVPRHPDRRDEIIEQTAHFNLNILLRGKQRSLPEKNTDIYIADTIGELGLFYRISSIACIGRSFSEDGGGGHNPIEAAQLGCAVLHGPNVQNLQDVFDGFSENNACIPLNNTQHFYETLLNLFMDEQALHKAQNTAYEYCMMENSIIDKVIVEIKPILDRIDLTNSAYNSEEVSNAT